MTGTALEVTGSGADQHFVLAVTPWQLPQQTLQFGFMTMAPASMKVSMMPSFNAWR